MNEKDSQGNLLLLLACRWNFEIAEMLMVVGASVSAAKKRGDRPLLAAVGAAKFELAEMLVSKGAVTSLLSLDSGSTGLFSLLCVCVCVCVVVVQR